MQQPNSCPPLRCLVCVCFVPLYFDCCCGCSPTILLLRLLSLWMLLLPLLSSSLSSSWVASWSCTSPLLADDVLVVVAFAVPVVSAASFLHLFLLTTMPFVLPPPPPSLRTRRAVTGGGNRGGREGQDAHQVQEDHRPRRERLRQPTADLQLPRTGTVQVGARESHEPNGRVEQDKWNTQITAGGMRRQGFSRGWSAGGGRAEKKRKMGKPQVAAGDVR